MLHVRSTSLVILCVALISWGMAQDHTGVDPAVEKLLSSMTLEEKIGQMTQVDIDALASPDHIAQYFLGSLLAGGDSEPLDISATGWATTYNRYQAFALKTRLQIPLIFGIDGVHGNNNVEGAVIFPHNIGLGATRNPGLVEAAGRVIAREIYATGINWTFAPCIAVARDERWGRTYESFGETPELAKSLGAAFIRGVEGERLGQGVSLVACAKHYLGDGGTTHGIDQGNSECDEATLRRIHLPGYAEAVRAGAGTIMVSYSSWNGIKMHGNRYLITDVLKGELGFSGFVVSDWAAIDQLPGDYQSDIETSINAGLDMIMIPNGPEKPDNYVEFVTLLKISVQEGKVPIARIDDAVRRILRVKMESGLFAHPYSDPEAGKRFGCPEHRAVARECVRQSLVLLKNDRATLPLSKNPGRIHVAGKSAHDIGNQCGGWTISWQGRSGPVISGGTTILSAIYHTVAPETRVTYSRDGSQADGADVGVVVIGETPYAEMKGDTDKLTLSDEDVAAVSRLKAAGIPVVAILVSGRPLLLDRILDHCDAILVAWLPGTEGQGVADVLFGDYRPVGKLPHSWPRASSPVNEGDADYDPLFPYGFGLTYPDPTGFVTIRGREILDPQGNPLLLRGINLGNWLVPEGYMFHFQHASSPRLIHQVIAELVGPDAAREFWTSYLDNYITRDDIFFIKRLGFNSVRVPFNFKLFLCEDHPEHALSTGFAMLDRVIAWCREAGLWVILDMHCAPGGQTGDNIDDSWGYPYLFEGGAAQQQAIDLWRKIAGRYRQQRTVIGYDLLNEPIPHFVDKERLNPRLEPLYRKIAAAIREVDHDHLIFLGGAQWNSNFAVLGEPFDPRLVYTFHKYWTEPTHAVIQDYLDFSARYNVPIWMGESGENTDEWIAAFRKVLEKNGVGWCFWPYKKLDATSCIVSIRRPEEFQKIIDYAEAPRRSLGEVRSARPPREVVERALAEFLRNCRLEHCTVNRTYVNALIGE